MLFINFDKTVSKVGLIIKYLTNKLKGNCFIGHDTKLNCTNTLEYTHIPSCMRENRLRLIPPTRTNICLHVYTRKLYNKANLFIVWRHVWTCNSVMCKAVVHLCLKYVIYLGRAVQKFS